MRNLGLTVAMWLAAILPTSALALGLGEIEVKSFLNQPLEAEIEVISARPGEIDDLLVSLASREAFSRAGLARPSHLSDLRFTVRKSESGEEAVIVVSTKDGVKEPFLNFLIEADWSKGRVLREFTVLLDPPFYADQPPPVEPASQTAAAPVTDDSSVSEIVEQSGVTSTGSASSQGGQSVNEPIALSDSGASSEQIAAAQPPAPEPLPEPEPVQESSSFQYTPEPLAQNLDGEVSVARGDTMWGIASRFKDSAHSMSQVMLAFQRTNPEAFNDGNINNLKEGAILRVPSASEFDVLDQQSAYAEVLVQNGLWDEYVARVSGTVPAMAVEQESPAVSGESETAAAESESELSLLPPADGSSESAGTGDSADSENLRTRLALAEEELEASRIENRDLQSRISELQARLSKLEELQKMVEIEDDSFAQIQGGETGQSMDSPETVEQDTGGQIAETDLLGESDKALLEELLAEEAAAQAEEAAALAGQGSDDGMVSDEQAADGMASDEPAADGMASDESAADGMVSGEPANDAMTAGEAPADDNLIASAPATDTSADTSGSTDEPVLTAPPAPVIVTEQAVREPSILDGILPQSVTDMMPSMPSSDGLFGDPITLAALGGAVILLILLLLVRRKKNAAESESGIVAGAEEDLFAGDEDDELTPIHIGEGETPESTDINVPTEEDIAGLAQQTLTSTAEITAAEAEDDFAKTAIISAAEMPQAEEPAAEPPEQDDVLNEVDVYLAYGLYDNAEELLKNSLAENPERPDYRSKLLDTYFATKNSAAFVGEAEKLKSMGSAADRYWDRVQVMGYELAPDNALFSDAKDSGLSAADLEIAKPQEADFDLGATDDDTNFSTTDFNLGEEDTGGDFEDVDTMAGGGQIAKTEVIPQVELPAGIDDEEETPLKPSAGSEDDDLELPDDIGGELEFSMEDDLAAASTDDDDLDLAMNFDIDDDAATDEDPSDINFSDEIEDESDADDLDLEDAVELGLSDEEPEEDFLDATEAIAVHLDAADLRSQVDEDDADVDETGFDLGMDDTGIMDLTDPNLDIGQLQIPDNLDDDEDEDISVLDFGEDDFVEATEVVQGVGDLDDASALDEEADDDFEANAEVKTGTFAPGDFEEPSGNSGSIADLDDLDDLMLPDDVDEVSTKLDLARAFIDMGDSEGARGSLEEVLVEGNAAQKQEAQALLAQI